MHTKLLGFELLTDLYGNDYDFCKVWNACDKRAFGDFYRHDGFLFKRDRLCVSICSICELLVRESHGGGLMGHFSIHKTLGILNEHFYWSNMKHNVQPVSAKCITCR